MSLRTRLGLEDDVYTGKTRILILKPESQSPIGMIVDAVKEVLTLDADSIEKPSAKESGDDQAVFLSGVGKNGEGLISILNIMGVIQDEKEEEK